MAMGRDCFAHRHRDDVPLELHHVWPKSYQGPDVRANRIMLCSNAHSATHDLLSKMMAAHTAAVPWKLRRRYGRKVRRLAEAGYKAIHLRVIVTP